MGVTHRPMASAWWLGGVLLLDSTATSFGAGVPVNPLVAGIGALVAPVFGAGRLSPDADVSWLRHLGHRQATHRPDTTALALTGVTLVVWLIVRFLADPPIGTDLLVWAPVTGWWSHLVGDWFFGRIPVGVGVGRVLAGVLPGRLISASNGRQAYWTGLGLDTDGLIERGTVRTQDRRENGLHRTYRPWWMFGLAPTTTALKVAVAVLYAIVTVQFVASLMTGRPGT